MKMLLKKILALAIIIAVISLVVIPIVLCPPLLFCIGAVVVVGIALGVTALVVYIMIEFAKMAGNAILWAVNVLKN